VFNYCVPTAHFANTFGRFLLTADFFWRQINLKNFFPACMPIERAVFQTTLLSHGKTKKIFIRLLCPADILIIGRREARSFTVGGQTAYNTAQWRQLGISQVFLPLDKLPAQTRSCFVRQKRLHLSY
jgi:hypothetical protein